MGWAKRFDHALLGHRIGVSEMRFNQINCQPFSLILMKNLGVPFYCVACMLQSIAQLGFSFGSSNQRHMCIFTLSFVLSLQARRVRLRTRCAYNCIGDPTH